MNLTKILNYCTKKFSWLRCWKNLSFGFLELKYRTHGGETWHQGHRLCSQTEGITLESRHLSLVMPSEIPYLRDMLRRLAELLETFYRFRCTHITCRHCRRLTLYRTCHREDLFISLLSLQY